MVLSICRDPRQVKREAKIEKRLNDMFNPYTIPYAPTEEEIRIRAYSLWERAGSPYGDDLKFWFMAKDIIVRRFRLSEKEARLP